MSANEHNSVGIAHSKEYSIERIPAAFLLEVTEIAAVYSATIAKTKDLIVLTSTSGATKNITKAEFVAQKFCNLQGKEIKLISMRANKEYMVYHIINRHAFAVKVPRKSNVVIHVKSGIDMTAGKVIVAEDRKIVVNADGTYNLSAGHIMSEAIFRKTCILRSISNELLSQIQNKPVEEVQQERPNIQNTPPVQQPEQQPVQPEYTSHADDVPISIEPVTPTVQKPEMPKTNKGKLVARCNNRQGKLVGYYVQTDAGASYLLNEQQIAGLCEKDAFTNVTVVHDSGKVYLRGVGCSLSELPIMQVD